MVVFASSAYEDNCMCKSLVQIPYQGLGFASLTISQNRTGNISQSTFSQETNFFLEIALSDVSQYQQGTRVKSLP